MLLKECLPTLGNSGHCRRLRESEPETVVPTNDQQITDAQWKFTCSEHSHKSRPERERDSNRCELQDRKCPVGQSSVHRRKKKRVKSRVTTM